MKKLMIAALFFCGSCFADYKIVNVMEFQELTDDMAVEFSKGTTLPLNLFLKGDLVEAEDTARLEVKQTFYVRFVEGELLFSVNLEEWKGFEGFVTGVASVLFSQATVTAGVEANLK